jgi:hypothetical protein
MNIYNTNKLELVRQLSHLCSLAVRGGVEFRKVI